MRRRHAELAYLRHPFRETHTTRATGEHPMIPLKCRILRTMYVSYFFLMKFVILFNFLRRTDDRRTFWLSENRCVCRSSFTTKNATFECVNLIAKWKHLIWV